MKNLSTKAAVSMTGERLLRNRRRRLFWSSAGRAALLLGGAAVIGQGVPLAQDFGPTAVRDVAAQRAAPRFVPGELIVKLKPAARAAGVMSPMELQPLGLQPSPRMTSGGELIYSFSPSTLSAMRSPQEARDRVLAITQNLSARPDVEYAQPNWILQHQDTIPNDPGYPFQWHYWNNGSSSTGESPGGINLPKAWDQGTGSHDVAVAIIDTGILPGHADIAGSLNLAAGYDMISDTFIANDGDGRDTSPTDPGDATTADECFPGSQPEDNSWHGTHVAGTVGVGYTNNSAGVAGVNWQLRLVPVRVLGKCGGTIADINDAIRWAAGLPVPGVPNNPDPARVINLSLGGPGACSASPSTQSAIDDAVAAGATVVVAAGNDAADAADYMPASCNQVITVAASDYRGHLVTRYSNFGDTVEIMGPGGDVQRDDNGDGYPDGVLSTVDGGYAFYNGTSMAAPHVSGVAALHVAANTSLTPAEVLTSIQDNALPRSSEECPKPCGAGLLNASIVPALTARFEYSAKLVCGLQKDPASMRLTRGYYATAINVHNPQDNAIGFKKKIALSVPPGDQRPGKILPTLEDKLGPDEALSIDCDDLAKRYFDGQLPASFIEGFVVIRSPESLDVTAVYSTATMSREGLAGDHSGIHVEQVRERTLGAPATDKPDLVVRDIGQPRVNCPGGAGTCVTQAELIVANIGGADAGTFTTRVTLDPAQTVTVEPVLPGLAAGASQSFTIMTPRGGNCYDPDCTICATVDAKSQVDESNESNNQLCETTGG